MINHNFPILLVEDNKHDVFFVRRAWQVNRITNPLYVVPHGQACLDYLRHVGDYADPEQHPRPGIIMMDIRMPIMDGIECLQQIRADPSLRLIPVIMLTTSKEDADRLRSYQIGCNTFIQKPVDFENLATAVRAIHLYWTISELP
ncbi:MAG: response regulator [Candidatus Promineifilaceae bacterium]